MTQENNNKPDRLVIISKAAGRNFERIFFLEIQAAILAGYRIAETDLRDDESMRLFRGRLGRAVLYKEGTQPDKWVPAVVEAVAAPVKNEAPIVKEEIKDLSTGKAENTPLEKDLTPLQQLSELSKVKELKEFAKDHKVEIPDTIKNPKAIAKIIKEALEALAAS